MSEIYGVDENPSGFFVTERIVLYRSRRRYPTWAHSSYYTKRAEAEHLRAWLAERHAGYPVNLMLAADSP